MGNLSISTQTNPRIWVFNCFMAQLLTFRSFNILASKVHYKWLKYTCPGGVGVTASTASTASTAFCKVLFLCIGTLNLCFKMPDTYQKGTIWSDHPGMRKHPKTVKLEQFKWSFANYQYLPWWVANLSPVGLNLNSQAGLRLAWIWKSQT